MKIQFELSNGEILTDDNTVSFWRQKVLIPFKKLGIKIKKVTINDEPFQVNADGYFMIFSCNAVVNANVTIFYKGIGYIKKDTNRARIIWERTDGEQLVEVQKPIPEFIYDIMVEREK